MECEYGVVGDGGSLIAVGVTIIKSNAIHSSLGCVIDTWTLKWLINSSYMGKSTTVRNVQPPESLLQALALSVTNATSFSITLLYNHSGLWLFIKPTHTLTAG